MITTQDQTWDLFFKSGLFPESALGPIRLRFDAHDSSEDVDPTRIVQWMIEEQLISEYQSRVFMAGRSGPFVFDSYQVFDRLTDSENRSDERFIRFRARQPSSGHVVTLNFFGGHDDQAIKSWEKICNRGSAISKISQAGLMTVYDVCETPQYRFVVSENFSGSPFSEKLPRKGRLPWQSACATASHIAFAMQHLHDAGLIHALLCPDTIWFKKGFPRLVPTLLSIDHLKLAATQTEDFDAPADYVAPELLQNDLRTPTVESDMYSLGAILFRMIRGEPPLVGGNVKDKAARNPVDSIEQLAKYKLPGKLIELFSRLLDRVPGQRTNDAGIVAELLAEFGGREATNYPQPKLVSSEVAYLDWLRRNKKINSLTELESFQSSSASKNTDLAAVAISQDASIEPTEAHRQRQIRKRNQRWAAIGATAASVVAFVAIVYGIYKSGVSVDLPRNSNDVASDDSTNLSPGATDLNGRNDSNASGNAIQIGLTQDLIDDDHRTLWESPTTASNIVFDYVPGGADIVFAMRPSAIAQNDEWLKLIRALGPTIEDFLATTQAQLGLNLPAIEQIVVSLHPGRDGIYEVLFVVRMSESRTIDELENLWGHPARQSDSESGTEFFVKDEMVFWIPGYHDDAESAAPAVTDIFVAGNKELVSASAEVGSNALLPRVFTRLAERTDAQRHFSMLFTRPSLFNEQGQKLMSGNALNLNRELNLFFEDEVTAILFSVHVDEGCYWEFIFENSVDVQADDVAQAVRSKLAVTRDQIADYLATIPGHPYWNKIRLRYYSMISDIQKRARVGVEGRMAMLNGWLPPSAGHNLVAASELVLASTPGQAAEVVTKKVPATIEALLETKRDLVDANPPDLNVLLETLKNDVISDNRGIKFEFDIRLLSNDLEKGSITRNQRPSALDLKQMELGDLLTQIMFLANPDKNATSPADPKCTLIWVVADDPDQAGRRIVLVTTRAAAEEKGYVLPKAFQTE